MVTLMGDQFIAAANCLAWAKDDTCRVLGIRDAFAVFEQGVEGGVEVGCP
jgi:hypothetical protein